MQCHAPGLVAVMKFKTTKINFEGLFGLSTKISNHEKYGTIYARDHGLRSISMYSVVHLNPISKSMKNI